MAQSADLPRFVISKVDVEAEQQAASGGGGADTRSTDTPINGNMTQQTSLFHHWLCKTT